MTGMECGAIRRGSIGGVITALLWCSGFQAQEIGDRVRVRMEEQQDWIDGSLLDFDPEGTFLMRGSIPENEEQYRVADLGPKELDLRSRVPRDFPQQATHGVARGGPKVAI